MDILTKKFKAEYLKDLKELQFNKYCDETIYFNKWLRRLIHEATTTTQIGYCVKILRVCECRKKGLFKFD